MSTALLAALVSLLAHVGLAWHLALAPLGDRTRGLGDYVAQYYPFHARLLHALGGSQLSDLTFSWTAGGGMGTLPDYAYYTSGPFPLLLLPFGLEHLDTGMLAMILLRLACVAAASALAIRRLTRARSVWLPAMLGVLASLSGWVFDTAIYTPMWIDGAIALPLLVLVGIWCLERRRFYLGTAVVALLFWSNFYSAWMGALGAVVLVVLYAAAERLRPVAVLAGMVRFAVVGALGCALTAWLLLPTLLATRNGIPYPGQIAEPSVPAVLTRLATMTEGVVSTPGLACASAPLALALGLPFARVRTLWARLVWFLGTLALAVASLTPTGVLVWSLGQAPHGNTYRFSFVITFALLVCAATCVSTACGTLRWPGPVATLVGALALGALAVLTVRVWFPSLHVSPDAWIGPVVAAALLWLGSWVSTRSDGRSPALRPLAATLVIVSLAEALAGGAFIDSKHDTFLARLNRKQGSYREYQARADLATRLADWPTYRVGTGYQPSSYPAARANTAAWLEEPALGYYSSTAELQTMAAFSGLGWNGRAGLRVFHDSPDPVADPLLAVRTRFWGDGAARWNDAMPMVRTVEKRTITPRVDLPDPWASRNALLDEPIYTTVVIRASLADGTPLRPTNGVITLPADQQVLFRAACPAGTRLSYSLRNFTGRWKMDGPEPPAFATHVGTLLADSNRANLRLTPRETWVATAFAGCLDQASLARQIDQTMIPRIEAGPGTISAQWSAPQLGTAIVAAPSIRGWSCQVDGRNRPVGQRGDLIAVDMRGGTDLTCHYVTPGLKRGAAVSGATLLLLLATAVGSRLLRRRRQLADQRG